MREHTGTSIAIGTALSFAFVIWGAVVAVMLWSGITVYAIVKWIGSPGDHASPTTLLVMMIGLVTTFPLLLGVGIFLISKPMRNARRRAKKDAEQLTLPVAEEAA